MKTVSYYIVDVFAENKYEGNQLAVFLEANALTDKEMLNIAKEVNYAEVSFILSNEERDHGFDVRIFTPVEEVPFAGHPSLGTAFVIKNYLLNENVEQVNLHVKAGTIPVTINNQDHSNDLLWMKQLEPEFLQTFHSQQITEVLGIDESDLDLRYPIQEVSTGLPTIIVPLKSLKSLEKCIINRDKYFKLVNSTQAKLIHAFCPETYNERNHMNVRNFGDYYGVSEEPATGSANGCLAGYLIKHHYFNSNEFSIIVEQGREVGRLGHLYLHAKQAGETIEVRVGGKVVPVAKGEFYV
ncbi:trans-2,3-dihydro-3-hydroxyanthranilate isomerase [Bacillus mesophilus]|uniref:PhzF family phenazine biosynthesis protein n=1 Tax=Bacillus mesophilus TaxID=1808955 RepID=A0A6M0Q4Z8_9BACI|nr:PhzF family phenazine biosynthesis protein [Bacillus mesophilus]MBM7661004.1 trans-2,3-dihydro-3-hydroxyanthranilate isomerase [Bacillus mesophilus]NEY71456.1 PhzF family phenazine biosynthesis protein [Bacillus mesophilus]